ncbi:MAG: DUF853 family protein [Gammaproteobacteria bacterium]|nr:DUF853 family protein [Gammaproteobacteria bacterium]
MIGGDQVGQAGQISLMGKMANRHGLIAGATGTGKTVTLQVLAEQFSAMGVPVFMADVKGDLSGISQAGKPHPKVDERVEKIGLTDHAFRGSPVVFWDLYGEQGHPVRTTVTEMGPTLLSRLMDLNDTQEGILNIVFDYADDEGLLLLDLDDLRTTLQYVGDNASEFRSEYGNISPASVGAIQRNLLVLERDGADKFFGEPGLDLWDLMRPASDGRGNVNILAADKLMQSPRLYSTFLLWMLSELFENLPEVGDLDKPKFVFFFDEAHLLFADAPKALIEKIELVVRLIRSKGVGVYFITQNPMDVPVTVLGQLGNRVQHALRAFTPSDQKAVRSTAQTMRPNPELDIEAMITSLGVGEALVSTLDESGTPGITQSVLVCPPWSRIGPASDEERAAIHRASPFGGRYDTEIDRESAHEILQKRAEEQAKAAEEEEERERLEREERRGRGRDNIGTAMVKSLGRSMASYVGRSLGRQLLRGLLGGLLKR